MLGHRLRAIRMERGLSVRDLAPACGLAFNTISLIERAKISPTVSTLHKLATALGVPLSYFVSEDQSRRVVLQRKGERSGALGAHMLIDNLGVGLPNQTLQLLLVTLQPGAESGPDPIVHLGHEFAFCLEGLIEYRVEAEVYTLRPEDSLLFEAHLPHRWKNAQDSPSRLLLVIQAAEGREVALRQHMESTSQRPKRPRRGTERESPETDDDSRTDIID
jgi:transcriptional regulator with XRE-family HTH domain